MSLKEKYEQKIKTNLVRELKLDNPLAAPKLEKIVINMGTGDDLKDKGVLENLSQHLALISGQKPSVQPAKISVAGFGIRTGMAVGLKVTLRGERMYAFLEKLISVTLPRLRDFRGVSLKSFDRKGNYTLGIADYTVFPEIDLGKVDRPRGLEITIVVQAQKPEHSRKLLEALGMPFAKEEENG